MRPSFASAWGAFMQVNRPVKVVGEIIGGKVKVNIDLPPGTNGRFENACPIRMSYVLNHTGFFVRRDGRYKSVSGSDGRRYLFRVRDMRNYLEEVFGKPEKEVKRVPTSSDFAGMKGILVVQGTGWGNASGHVTLWNGTTCSDSCHFAHDPDNGSFHPVEAALWTLP